MRYALPFLLAVLLIAAPASAFPVPKAAKVEPSKLAGTTWSGSTSWGANPDTAFEITFQADGVLVYHPDRKCSGKWKLEDRVVKWDINNYSHYTGKIDGGNFTGTGRNGANQNATFKFTLRKE